MKPRTLQGLEVVITRPVGQVAPLQDKLQAAGARTTSIPLIAILPLTGSDQRQRIRHCIEHLSQYQHAIFISQNAAQQAWVALAEYQQCWPTGLQAYAVGRSTAAWLATQGIQAITPERMDSEGLLALPALQQVQGQRGVIFRGLGGRETLAQGLRARGMQVDYCELYRRRLPADAPARWQQWRQQLTQVNARPARPAVVCLNSRETLDNLLAVDEHCTRLRHIHWLVPGARVADAAKTLGFRNIIQAADALDDTLLDTLAHWVEGGNSNPRADL